MWVKIRALAGSFCHTSNRLKPRIRRGGLSSYDFDTFAANDEKVYAIMQALEIIGEAAKKVPRSAQARYPDVPWRDVAGMRDKLIHSYFNVNLRRVWRTVREDLPSLQAVLERMLADRAADDREG